MCGSGGGVKGALMSSKQGRRHLPCVMSKKSENTQKYEGKKCQKKMGNSVVNSKRNHSVKLQEE